MLTRRDFWVIASILIYWIIGVAIGNIISYTWLKDHTISTICLDEIEYYTNYKNMLAPKFNPDGTLSQCQ